MKRLVVTLTAVLAVATIVRAGRGTDGVRWDSRRIEAATAGAQEYKEPRVTQRMATHGHWRSQRDPSGAKRAWHIHSLKREDGSLKARLSVLGVPGMDGLTIEGHAQGSEAFGVLLDGTGAQVATFNATMFANGRSGTYSLGNGESGTWSYGGAAQEESKERGVGSDRGR